jgi:hypothetical protein
MNRVWDGTKWVPFVSYEHNAEGNLVFDLGKGKSVTLPENSIIKERSDEWDSQTETKARIQRK